MNLSPKQLKRFWSKQDGWPSIVSLHNWSPEQAEDQRHAMLQRAGFQRLTEVTRVKGFAAVLEQMAVLKNDVAGIVHAQENPRRVLLDNIRTLAAKFSLARVDSCPFNPPISES
jgi:hypothetical protein